MEVPMFNKEKLDEIFIELTWRTENCKNILEFKEIANVHVQEAINVHREFIENNIKVFTEFLVELVERLKLCIPKDIPYYPVLVLDPNTNQLTIGYARKGARLPMFDDATLKTH